MFWLPPDILAVGRRNARNPDCDGVAAILPTARGMASLLGRSLAMCVHPVAAWRRGSLRGRVVVVGAYALASYAAVLLALTFSIVPF